MSGIGSAQKQVDSRTATIISIRKEDYFKQLWQQAWHSLNTVPEEDELSANCPLATAVYHHAPISHLENKAIICLLR
ncbi:MAG: hypothetical protein ACKPKO_50155, partial [Candidatus Fonsibacter sp.]